MDRSGSASRPSLTLTLSMERDALNVAYSVTEVEFAEGSVFLDLPTMTVGVPTADLVEAGLQITDELGVVAVQVAAPRPSTVAHSALPSRTLVALGRDTHGTVHVSYRARPTPMYELTPGPHPPTDLRRHHNGISGQGWAFLALPDLGEPFTFRLRWDLPVDNVAVTSLGEGDIEFVTGLRERIYDAFFMIGDVATAEGSAGVSTHRLDSFSPETLDVLTGYLPDVRRSVADWLGETAVTRHSVFPRAGSGATASGAAIQDGMILDLTHPGQDERELRSLLDHESVHEWPCLADHDDVVGWHDEGLAEYLALILPAARGDISTAEFLARVNLRARLAYASPLRAAPLKDLQSQYWLDPVAQREPYLRGLFYFARLEYALKHESHTTLRQVMREVRRRVRAGQRVDMVAWVRVIREHLGEVGNRLTQDVTSGGAGLPEVGLWGPAFDQVSRMAPVVDPGFGGSCFASKVVDVVRPGSPADAAGLEPGDRLLNLPSFESVASGRHGNSLDLDVERGSHHRRLTMAWSAETASVPVWIA